jgi:hypothetical protein
LSVASFEFPVSNFQFLVSIFPFSSLAKIQSEELDGQAQLLDGLLVGAGAGYRAARP